jgi:hypothetical protein
LLLEKKLIEWMLDLGLIELSPTFDCDASILRGAWLGQRVGAMIDQENERRRWIWWTRLEWSD